MQNQAHKNIAPVNSELIPGYNNNYYTSSNGVWEVMIVLSWTKKVIFCVDEHI